jgi:exosortase E/protease (VPEID-CTERM system)
VSSPHAVEGGAACGAALAAGIAPGSLRWPLPAALLVVEYLSLSLLVDFPLTGPAMALVGLLRLLVPVLIGAGAAGWLLARRAAGAPPLPPMPGWRPWPFLGAHLAAFAATACVAWRLFGAGAPPLSRWALVGWIGAVALTVALAIRSAAPFGWTLGLLVTRWRVPILALAGGLLCWRAAAAAEGLWGALSGATLQSVAWLLRAVSSDVTLDVAGRVVGLDGFDVEVAPICSGVDGIGLVVMFQALWISMARSRIRVRRALLLLPAGALAAVIANVLRVAALLWVGASGREALAMGGLHSKLGWLLFLAIALVSVAAAERLPWLQRRGAEPETAEGLPGAAAAYVAPLVAAVGAALVTGILAAGFDRWYAVRIVAAIAALASLRRSLPRHAPSPSAVPLLLGACVGALWIAWVRGDGHALVAGLARLGAAERWVWIGVRVVGSCLVIPVIEELAFRGFLLPWLVSPSFEAVPPRAWTWGALAISSLAFGALHGDVLAGSAAGLAFAAARLHRGRLGDAILAHGVANAAVAVAVLWGGRWDLWS